MGAAARLPHARTAAAAGAAAAGLLVAAATAGVTLHDQHAAAPTRSSHPVAWDGRLGGVPLQRARCEQWAAAAPAQRGAAVRALSATIGGASTGGGVGTTMPAARVTALFNRVCSTPQTSGFVLYMIYARAAAFSRVGAGGV